MPSNSSSEAHAPAPSCHQASDLPGLAPRGPRSQQQWRLPRRAPLALACPQDFADTGQRSTGPRPGGLDPRPDPGQDPADQR